MKFYTIEIYRHGDVFSFMTFKGLLGYTWEMRAEIRWCFRRAGFDFTVLGMNTWVDQELASVAVDHFLKPSTDVEQIDLRRIEFVPPLKASKK